jgi:phthalate 4,5-dioxygenase
LRAARAFKKDEAVPPGVDNPDVYVNVRSGDFLADEKVSWRDAYAMQQRTALRPLAQAAE